MKPDNIKTGEPFERLFPVDAATLNAIADHMQAHGYDAAHPVVLWKERGVLIDGHTRLLAARSAGVADVPVVSRSFADEDSAVEYAIHCQRDRRNLTDADLIRWIAEVDKRKTKSEAGKGGREKQLGQAQPCACPKKTAEATAEIVGTSPRKVEQVRTVLDKATPEVKAAVETGKMSINAAYNETRKEAAQTRTTKEVKTYHGKAEDFTSFLALYETAQDALDAMKALRVPKDTKTACISKLRKLQKAAEAVESKMRKDMDDVSVSMPASV